MDRFDYRIRDGKIMTTIDSFYDIYNLGIKDPDIIDAIDEGEYKLMQYTGLTDKNGKEIYEGDIVKIFFGVGTSWETSETIEVERDAGMCGFEPFSDSRGNCQCCGGGTYSKECEVIGNIYENKDLIPNKK